MDMDDTWLQALVNKMMDQQHTRILEQERKIGSLERTIVELQVDADKRNDLLHKDIKYIEASFNSAITSIQDTITPVSHKLDTVADKVQNLIVTAAKISGAIAVLGFIIQLLAKNYKFIP